MQGNLNEIDIRSILQLVELGQRTGELFVEAWPIGHTEIYLGGRPRLGSGGTLPEQSWFVFFSKGCYRVIVHCYYISLVVMLSGDSAASNQPSRGG